MSQVELETKPQLDQPPIEVNHCHHGDHYSITLVIENRHVDLASYGYDHRPGSHSTVTIFELQPRDVIALATRLLDITQWMS
jgi:hypothetical protein